MTPRSPLRFTVALVVSLATADRRPVFAEVHDGPPHLRAMDPQYRREARARR